MSNAAEVLKGLDPTAIWSRFAELTTIPRPSKQEGKVRAWVLGIAQKNGWKHREDSVGNIVIDVPAAPGCEKAPLLTLQSHLDMVCEKNADVKFDFDRDPLRLRIVGDEVRATGTTLGADNGIGVCAMLAAAAEPNLRRPALELLFTIDEETGLTGAAAISPQILRGRRMINLDSEEDDVLYIGCAGGRTSTLRTLLSLSAPAGGEVGLTIRVSGLKGGHSGGEIHENRGNANKLLARALARVAAPLRLVAYAGGNKHNAIPREASATLLVASSAVAAVKSAVEATLAEARKMLTGTDDGVQIAVAEAPASPAASAADSRRLIDLVNALPDGVLGTSRVIKGLVETSNNVAVVATEATGGKAEISIVASSRSSSAPHLQAIIEQVAGASRLAGFEVTTGDGYPGWAPNRDSQLLGVCRSVYEKEFGVAPHVTAIHAGLECGVIGERVGGVDMISFGPTIRMPHSPDENVSIASVGKFWRYLKAALAALATA